MNKLIATITDIQNEDSLNIVSFDYHDVRLVMMSLEISKDLSIGTQVVLSVNPSHIGIGKSFDANLSYSNIIEMKIEDIEIGKLLASIKLNHHDNTIESIITANSTKRMPTIIVRYYHTAQHIETSSGGSPNDHTCKSRIATFYK
jgi:ABC-type molybdate transport system ATPase subunit